MVVLVLGVVALTYWAVVDYTWLPGRSRRSAASEAGMLLAVVLFHICVSCCSSPGWAPEKSKMLTSCTTEGAKVHLWPGCRLPCCCGATLPVC